METTTKTFSTVHESLEALKVDIATAVSDAGVSDDELAKEVLVNKIIAVIVGHSKPEAKKQKAGVEDDYIIVEIDHSKSKADFFAEAGLDYKNPRITEEHLHLDPTKGIERRKIYFQKMKKSFSTKTGKKVVVDAGRKSLTLIEMLVLAKILRKERPDLVEKYWFVTFELEILGESGDPCAVVLYLDDGEYKLDLLKLAGDWSDGCCVLSSERVSSESTEALVH
ncbi:MAG: hypothetical protein AAB870_04300 [Patescibacteria group bacterium]